MKSCLILVIAFVALLHSACTRAPVSQKAIPRPNILLVTIDTLRADRLTPALMPVVSGLSSTGLHFTSARTTVPLTLPAHASIMTGLLPPEHGVRENGVDRLSDRHATIARMLMDAGYRTAAFIGAYVLDRRFGLMQGFSVYDDRVPRDHAAAERLEAERPGDAVVARALEWLATSSEGAAAATPFFAWVHLYDPHAPYRAPEAYRARAANAYDAEVIYADAQVGRLVEWLREGGLTDRTVVVVTGDHGEGLGEHGEQTHGMLLYDSTLRVPLVIVAPGRAAERSDEPVSLVDLAPTIVRIGGVTPPAVMRGRNLLEGAVAVSTAAGTVSDLYAETEYPRVGGWSALQALTDGRWMGIRAGPSMEIYDLHRDPAQLQNVAASQQTIASAMTTRIAAIESRASPRSKAATVPVDVSERLRTLGYVTSTPARVAGSVAPNPATHISAWNTFEDALAGLFARRPEAIAHLQRLATDYPDAPVFQMTYARALMESGKAGESLTVYRRAVKQWPTDAVLMHDLAVAARDAAAAAGATPSRALREEAIRAEEAALILAPDYAPAHNGRGLLAIEDERFADALAAFTRATTIDPNNASYWTNLGNARRALADPVSAEQAYRRALDIDPATADALNGIGVLLVEANRNVEAASWFERALAATPDFAEARLNLGIALQQSGQAARAAEQYRRLLAATNAPRERAAAAKLLASLGAR